MGKVFDSIATSAEALAKLPPAFGENAALRPRTPAASTTPRPCSYSCQLPEHASWAPRRDCALVARAEAGVRPEIMGSGPIPTVEQALAKAGLTVDDLDVVELNEAFRAVAAACSLALGLDPEKVNPNGGAIALGHPSAPPAPSWRSS
jgi:acetyl-CoA C-acetyltransferase